MNSPPDPGSPISTDSESPPPDELLAHTGSSQGFISHLTQSLVGGSKRRLPGGSSTVQSSSNRDPKTRRRMELAAKANATSGGGSAGTLWDAQKEMKREERELVDHQIVEYLRKEIGDPFQDGVILRHA